MSTLGPKPTDNKNSLDPVYPVEPFSDRKWYRISASMGQSGAHHRAAIRTADAIDMLPGSS